MVRRAYDRYYPYCDACCSENPGLDKGVCTLCHKERDLHLFAGFDKSVPCNYCSATYNSFATKHLEGIDLQPGGKPRTVSQILAASGFPRPTKSDLNTAARYFREKGLPAKKRNGRTHFVIRLPGEGADVSEFAMFEKAHPEAVKALGLPEGPLRAFRDSAIIPTYLRLAMAAALLGVPPYEGKEQ